MQASICRCTVGARPSPGTTLRFHAQGMPLVTRRRSYSGAVRAVNEKDNCSFNVSGEYCSIDSQAKPVRSRTLGEMEQEFIRAMESWYFEGKALLTDEEFEALKEELIWQGSDIAILSSDEQAFLEASMAYANGQPMMTDDEYDELKQKLKQSSSFVTAQGPRCSIRSKALYSDCVPDYTRMTLLNVPAILVVLGAVFTVDYVTGFQVTRAIELPEPFGPIFVWGLLLPTLYVLSTSITNLVLRDGTILKGPCPECNTENFTYFGDIFTIKGNTAKSVIACSNCSADLQYSLDRREIKVLKTAAEKEAERAAKLAKKKATAAKKAERLAKAKAAQK